jgi:hypothetical protein
MSQVAIIGVIGMIMCSSSSAAAIAMFMMSGGDDSSATPSTTPSTPAPQPTPTPAPQPGPKYRYVRIVRDKQGDDHWMNIAEVEVFSGTTNVASGKTVTASSLYSPWFPHTNLVDGNKANFAHTHDEALEYFQIDLGQEYDIDKVVITNRIDCCQGRLRNTKIQLSKSADMSSPKESRVVTTEESPRATITWSPKLGAELTAA